MRLLITGGAGFIGSNFIRHMLKAHPGYKITNLDSLTYAGNLENLKDIESNPNYKFIKGDICDSKTADKAVKGCDAIVNFAAESHVDRSITGPSEFIRTNIYGTHTLLEAAKKACAKKFLQVSCYDTTTRALTVDGLKMYRELKEGDKVFSLNPKTLEIEVKPVEKVIIQAYKGKMYHFRNKRIDLLVTPNHNMFICGTGKKRLSIERADECSSRSIFYMPEGRWIGKKEEFVHIKGHGKVKTKDLLYILGVFIGDGFTAYQEKQVSTKTGLCRESLLKKARDKKGRFKRIERQSEHRATCHSYRIFFDIPEKDKSRKKIEKTLGNLGIEYHCHKGKAGTHLYCTSRIFMELFDECGQGAHNKRIPKWALEYAPEYLRNLFQGLMDSDGSRSRAYSTVSEKLLSGFFELCIKLRLKPSASKGHAISFMNGRKIEGFYNCISAAKTRKSISRHRIKTTEYNGDVWCLKVKDNKNFLVERNGKIDFCGNTDEVYGSVEKGFSKEADTLKPNSPYSASKASADLLVRSYQVTYGLPAIITRSSNNFGPCQYPEKVIPLFVTNLMEDKLVPLYGDGLNVRDWVYVKDNCKAIDTVLHKGKQGETYNIAGQNLLSNIELTKKLLDIMGRPHSMIQPVKDRPGHDRRYALNSEKVEALGWKPGHSFQQAIEETVAWYKQNKDWWQKLKNKRV